LHVTWLRAGGPKPGEGNTAEARCADVESSIKSDIDFESSRCPSLEEPGAVAGAVENADHPGANELVWMARVLFPAIIDDRHGYLAGEY
jgi:hypothetical protein